MPTRQLLSESPVMLSLVLLIKRTRTPTALLLTLLCVARAFRETHGWPLHQPLSALTACGGLMILAGAALRLTALATLKKKEVLATNGIYALCRHPLYLGSMLLAYGYCALMADSFDFLVATAYFTVFYTVTIAWEEVRLAERYGAAHQAYALQTPLLLPFGRLTACTMSWGHMLRKGGLEFTLV